MSENTAPHHASYHHPAFADTREPRLSPMGTPPTLPVRSPSALRRHPDPASMPAPAPAPRKALRRRFWDFMTAKDGDKGDAVFRFTQLWIWTLVVAVVIVVQTGGPVCAAAVLMGSAAIPVVGYGILAWLALVFLVFLGL